MILEETNDDFSIVERVKQIAERAKSGMEVAFDEEQEVDDCIFPANKLRTKTKSDIQSLEHPFYSLSKKKDTRIRKFSYDAKVNGKRETITIEITPTVLGRATIYDKDILTYCSSQIIQAINDNEPVSRRVRIVAYHYLLDTKKVKNYKNISSKDYDNIEDQLKRLKGTMITTNVPVNGKRYKEGFSLIENFLIVRDEKTKRMESIEILLSEYHYGAIINKQVLTQSPHYYEIKSPFTKRMYEIARKHVGDQAIHISFLYKTLYLKSGSTASYSEFMRMMRKLIKKCDMPMYGVYENKEEGKFFLFRKDTAVILRKVSSS